jgi:glutamyl-tRNA synthetase
MKNLESKVRAYALKNAVSHEGKAMQGAVISGLFAEGLKKQDMKKCGKEISKIINEVNNLSLEEQKILLEKHKTEIHERGTRDGLPKLPNVLKSGVIMRFAPNPSGPLHLGHAISNVISSLFVKEYGGKFYVRIEDTNPEKVIKKCYLQFKKDCDWLFGNVSKYIIQSDRMEIYYKYAEKLLKKNSVYVCTCTQENFKELMRKKNPCPCRKLNIKENLERWEKMLDKKVFKQGEAVLRFKSDIKHPNPALRDFPLARINETPHPRQGKKYRVYPMMFLAVAVDDIEQKMTHVIRGKEHRDNAERQKLIYKALGLENKFPWTFFMGRIKFTDLDLSKRKIEEAIKKGKYSGWDDEKLPTLVSLKKRGYKPEAFWKLAEHRGLTQVDKVMSAKDFFKLLDEFNK